MKKIGVGVCLVLGLGLSAVQAQPPQYMYRAPRTAVPPLQATTAPDQLLRQGVDRLTGFLAGAGNASPAEIRAFIEPQIAPYFDFGLMARWAAGPYYRGLNPAQTAKLTAKIRDLFLTALTRNLGSFTRPLPRIEIRPARGSGRRTDQVSVEARVLPQYGRGQPTRLEFRFFRTPEGWKVFDVAANGTSAVQYYRRMFDELVRRRGPAALYN